MLEILKETFHIILYILGIVGALYLILGIISIPFEQKKKKEISKENQEMFEKLLFECLDEIKEESKKTEKKTTKKKAQE